MRVIIVSLIVFFFMSYWLFGASDQQLDFDGSIDKKEISSVSSKINFSSSSSSSSSSSTDPVLEKKHDQLWGEVSATSLETEKILQLIRVKDTTPPFKLVKTNNSFLDSIEQDDIFDVPVPDAIPVKIHVTDIKYEGDIRSVAGHLSGYPEAYYIGFSYDKAGNMSGSVTTEKANYSIRTYYGYTVMYKNIVDREKELVNDF